MPKHSLHDCVLWINKWLEASKDFKAHHSSYILNKIYGTILENYRLCIQKYLFYYDTEIELYLGHCSLNRYILNFYPTNNIYCLYSFKKQLLYRDFYVSIWYKNNNVVLANNRCYYVSSKLYGKLYSVSGSQIKQNKCWNSRLLILLKARWLAISSS